MSRKDAIFLVSRCLAIYLTVWVIADLTILFDNLFSAWHYLHESNALLSRQYWLNYYRLRTAIYSLRVIAFLVGARFFWSGGPRVEKLIFGRKEQSANPD